MVLKLLVSGKMHLERERDLAVVISTARKIETSEEGHDFIEPESPSSSIQINCAEKEDLGKHKLAKLAEREQIPTKAKRREDF